MDAERDELSTQLFELSKIVEPDEEGWTRRVFTEPYRASRTWIQKAFIASGLIDVQTDYAGNIVGRLPGRDPCLPPIVTGSHSDTVQGGGRFDGTVGVLGALATVRSLRSTGTTLNRDLLVYDSSGEEVNSFGVGCIGSRGLLGTLDAVILSQRGPNGSSSLGDAYVSSRLDASQLITPRKRPAWHAYLELHIEQSTSLESSGADVGVVVAIAGIRRLVARFIGEQNHAGGARMHDRRDAMVAAAHAVLRIHESACGTAKSGAEEHAVATTTHIENKSSSLNVIPSRVTLHGEMRSTSHTWLDTAERSIASALTDSARRAGADVEYKWTNDGPIVSCDSTLQDIITAAARDTGASWRSVPSGATHDAAHIAAVCPTGMIFVPSHKGLSHTPEEYTSHGQIQRGVDVLTESIIRSDSTNPLKRN